MQRKLFSKHDFTEQINYGTNSLQNRFYATRHRYVDFSYLATDKIVGTFFLNKHYIITLYLLFKLILSSEIYNNKKQLFDYY